MWVCGRLDYKQDSSVQSQESVASATTNDPIDPNTCACLDHPHVQMYLKYTPLPSRFKQRSTKHSGIVLSSSVSTQDHGIVWSSKRTHNAAEKSLAGGGSGGRGHPPTHTYTSAVAALSAARSFVRSFVVARCHVVNELARQRKIRRCVRSFVRSFVRCFARSSWVHGRPGHSGACVIVRCCNVALL